MATPIIVPKLGESVTSAILVRWIKQNGEKVAKDEPVCELETDKANVDVPATAAGVLKTLKKPGDTVAIEEAIAMVDESGVPSAVAAQPVAATAGAAAPAAAPTAARPSTAQPAGAQPATSAASTVPLEDLSPAVRVMVQEHNLDAAALQKTAPGGRLTKEFVQSYLGGLEHSGGNGVRDDGPSKNAGRTEKGATVASGATQTTPQPPVVPPPAGRGASERPATDPNAVPKDFDANGERRVKMSKIRQMIAKRLVQAQQTAAILTTFNEVDLTEVMALRSKYKEVFEKTHGVGLGFMSFFARAVVMGLKEFPRVNAYLEGDEILYHQHVHLGVAVSTDRGLTVPVLRNVDTMGFSRIESEIKRMAAAARDNKLSINELSGGTFSITNGGVFGSLLSTPILNPPQSGILGMHAIQKRPVAIGDKIEIRPMMYLALSYDHRVVDGKESISFLVRVKQSLEDPARLMLEI